MRGARQGGDARAQGVRQDLKALAAVLDRAPHEFAVLLDALAVRREYLNLEKCFLRARHAHRVRRLWHVLARARAVAS